MEARDIYFSSSSGGDDYYVTDVAVLFALHIDGPVVTRIDDRDWMFECERLLGILPPQSAIMGGAVKLQWLRDQFTVISPYLEEMEVEQYDCAYILHMFDPRLLPDTTTTKVHLRWLPFLEDLDVCGAMSWGSIVLVYLYSILYKISTMETKQLHVCLALLQVKS